MNHNEARLLIGADPHSVPPELAEHLASCPECAQFQREMIALDENIRRALEQAPLSGAQPGGSTAQRGSADWSRGFCHAYHECARCTTTYA